MSTTTILALVLGLCLGSGLWLVLVRIPAMRPVTFSQRLAPHLRAGRSGSRILVEPLAAQTPFGPLGRIVGPVLADVARMSQRLNPSNEALARRDYTVLMAFLMCGSAAVVLLGVVADLTIHALDPRTHPDAAGDT